MHCTWSERRSRRHPLAIPPGCPAMCHFTFGMSHSTVASGVRHTPPPLPTGRATSSILALPRSALAPRRRRCAPPKSGSHKSPRPSDRLFPTGAGPRLWSRSKLRHEAKCLPALRKRRKPQKRTAISEKSANTHWHCFADFSEIGVFPGRLSRSCTHSHAAYH